MVAKVTPDTARKPRRSSDGWLVEVLFVVMVGTKTEMEDSPKSGERFDVSQGRAEPKKVSHVGSFTPLPD